MPDLSLENSCQGHVIGIDEAGRGPWAGPVTITALWLNPDSMVSCQMILMTQKK